MSYCCQMTNVLIMQKPVISAHGNPVAMFRSLHKEGEETGGQLFVVGSVIIRYPSKVQKQTTFGYEHS